MLATTKRAKIKLKLILVFSHPIWNHMSGGNGGSPVEQTLSQCSTDPSRKPAEREQSTVRETIENNLTLWNYIIHIHKVSI